MLMFALSTCTSCSLRFTEEEVPLIRQWCCIQLMERFSLHGLKKHPNFFRKVREMTEPALLQMNYDKQNALRKVLGSDFSDAKDDFLFIFQCQEDTETFLSYCADEQGLKVNAMLLNQRVSEGIDKCMNT